MARDSVVKQSNTAARHIPLTLLPAVSTESVHSPWLTTSQTHNTTKSMGLLMSRHSVFPTEQFSCSFVLHSLWLSVWCCRWLVLNVHTHTPCTHSHWQLPHTQQSPTTQQTTEFKLFWPPTKKPTGNPTTHIQYVYMYAVHKNANTHIYKYCCKNHRPICEALERVTINWSYEMRTELCRGLQRAGVNENSAHPTPHMHLYCISTRQRNCIFKGHHQSFFFNSMAYVHRNVRSFVVLKWEQVCI